MEAIDKLVLFIKSRPLLRFPKGHAVALTVLAVALTGFSLTPLETNSYSQRVVTQIELPLTPLDDSLDAKIEQNEVTDTNLDPLAIYSNQPQPVTTDSDVRSVKIKSGDNLSLVFKRAQLNDKYMMMVLSGSKESKRLTSLFPGHIVEFTLSSEHDLQKVTYIVDRLNSFSFVKNGDRFDYSEHVLTPDVRMAQSAGTITQSLYTAGIEAKLDDKLIMELADIFGWDIDFALDIRKGDQFKVIYEEKFLDGEKIGNGSILAAEFINQGEKFQAIRYTNTRGEAGYYTPDGRSMRKEFLRAPLDFRRISSNFNPRRLHPITKTVRPHRGIDYAAPTGTPIWSSGSGSVIESAYTSTNGNFIVIQHGNGVQTKYLHLQKRLVKRGQKVKQKQTIGLLGSTGLSSGPHLHYEFLVNGVHRNPRTILNEMPKARSISAAELPRFITETRDRVAMLNDETPTQFATNDQQERSKQL